MTPARELSPRWILWVGLAVFAASIGIAAPQVARSLFSATNLLPHGVCYSWFPGLLWLHLVSDVMIGLAYFSIPVALVYFVRRRADLPFNWIFVLFGVFIVACGLTHWMEVWTLWNPHYWLSGTIKAVTAAASVPTAIATVLLIPQALSIPSTTQLRAAKEALEAEVAQRRRVEEELRRTQAELEERVATRTLELQRSREWLAVTLASIGDAVIATDVAGRVLLMNGVAERLTGWSQREAEARPLDEVFRIVNEASRASAPSPALRAVAQGEIVGLANHTLLVARDGTERPIDDSAAPIRDADGHVRGAVLIFRDIAERRANERQREHLTEALRQSNAVLDTLFEQSPIGLGLWDRECRFMRVNRALAEINGVSAEAHIGKRLDEVLPDMDPGVMAAFRSVLDTGVPILQQEVSGVTPAHPGRTRHWLVNYFPVRIGEAIRLAGATCDEITERKEAEAERARLLAAAESARADAERANRSKDVFLATLSHELRTPLQAMLGWVQLLDSGRLGEAQTRRAIERIGYNVRAQAQLINDLLDVSRIVTGKLRLAIESVDPAAVIDSAIDTLRPAAETKSVRIARVTAGTVPRIAADPDRLRQIVVNLLSNAIKFTPEGGAVEIGLAAKEGAIEIAVRDDGQGIDPLLLPLVFERFTQGAPRSGPQQGLGLGLAIVRNLVELHGGTARAASDGPGRGATFTVRLPVGKVPAAAEHTAAPAAPGAGLLEGVRVLVVEDVDDARETLVGGLADYGAVAEGAPDVPAAIERLAAGRPAVIVSDIGLPVEDGYALIARIRALGHDVPVIAVTAFGTNEDRDRALAAGFAEHLTKPVSLADLVRAVRRAARR